MTHAATCLWFSPHQAERAVELYTSLIPNSRVVATNEFRNDDQPGGRVRLWSLEIAGNPTQVMAASHQEAFTTAHSMWLVVDDQAELDAVWDGFLSAGGHEMQCGWIVDPFGVSWQVVPKAWEELTAGDDQERAQRVVEALWQMVKIDVEGLEKAARGE